ncbi:DNA mismatch repair protein MSH3 [Zancudomyces culisetae]|uniref:DNA mismatch repair protein MSH3 n=1 Tax=Zancudomyces culisetae TaxID=1213189 RepID=A0A1R1PZP6_ZANCU|nr:DNA mismatch repair protein MSH3 [Zancudomyces culisetae]|eukprot:OMH86426.1 DNA mismatch repair protein MSH3 [Zancudomyces culisetae]
MKGKKPNLAKKQTILSTYFLKLPSVIKLGDKENGQEGVNLDVPPQRNTDSKSNESVCEIEDDNKEIKENTEFLKRFSFNNEQTEEVAGKKDIIDKIVVDIDNNDIKLEFGVSDREKMGISKIRDCGLNNKNQNKDKRIKLSHNEQSSSRISDMVLSTEFPSQDFIKSNESSYASIKNYELHGSTNMSKNSYKHTSSLERLKDKLLLFDANYLNKARTHEEEGRNHAKGAEMEGNTQNIGAKNKLAIAENSFKALSNKMCDGKFTPLEKQFLEIKGSNKDKLLVVEVGYKFVLFGEDSEIAARVLGIYSTQNQNQNFKTSSFPTHRLMVHVRRLVYAGYKVGIVRQTETVALKEVGDNKSGPFKRALCEVYTKGTFISENGGDETVGSIVCVVDAIRKGVCTVGLVAADLSIGKIIVSEFTDVYSRMELEATLAHLQPAELILSATLSQESTKKCTLFNNSSCRIETMKQLNTKEAISAIIAGLDGLGAFKAIQEVAEDIGPLVTCAAEMLFRYLKQFKLEGLFCSDYGCDKKVFTNFGEKAYMRLDSKSMRSLYIFKADDESESLFDFMDHTKTPMGKRRLFQWLSRPLTSPALISQRQDIIETILVASSKQPTESDKDHTLFTIVNKVKRVLKNTGTDVENALFRIQVSRVVPIEVVKLLKTLKRIIGEVMDENNVIETNNLLLKQITNFKAWEGLYNISSKLLDFMDENAAKSSDWINMFVSHNIEGCGIDGHCYHTQLNQYHHAIDNIKSVWDSEVVGVLGYQLTPKFILGEETNNAQALILTGPNMGGKSTYINTLCTLVIMAHIGSYIPAEHDQALLTPMDAIFTRIGANDDILNSKSTFMVEMEETNYALKNATSQSLIILDELGRGTSSVDGYAIASSVLTYLLDIYRYKPLVVFATHFSQIARFYYENPLYGQVSVCHMSFVTSRSSPNVVPKCATTHPKGHDPDHQSSLQVDKHSSLSGCSYNPEDVVFLYKLVDGVVYSDSYGVFIARMAGIPEQVLRTALDASSELRSKLK